MNIIINGGTRGIGKEVVIRFAEDKNNTVLVTGRDEKSLIYLSNAFENIKILPFDISVIDKHSEAFKSNIYSHFRKVDILINMAGYLVAKDFMDQTNNEARMMMETNFFGPASVIRIVKPLMAAGSHIVNISSMGGFQGSAKFKGLTYYSASKAAIACLSECLANEFSGSDIRVNALALGAVQTEMLSEAFPGYKAPVDAQEMAEFICNFALNAHKFINGKIIPVSVSNPE
jgi:3-oxoacyl-[acyl-carrier protein] reductase